MAVVVLDNGAYTAKCGFSNDTQAKVMPNCIIKAKNVRTRIFVGDQIDDCKDLSGLYYLLAYQKGYLVNWEIQRQVWDHIFTKVLKAPLEDTTLIVTEPYFNFSSVQESMTELFFEDYQLSSIFRCNAGLLSQYKARAESPDKHLCTLVVDSGYSFTHIIPYYQGKAIPKGVCRINVGGKILTNHLKEVISYRQLMVMDETHVMNQCKEDACFMSQDFWKDMDIARKRGAENTIVCDYVLPDYTHIKRGYIRSLEESKACKGAEQTIRLNNERFAIPEILMHPSDVGIQEMGIPEAIVYSINRLQEEMHPHMYNNIWLTGGNCHISGFKERIEKELRALAPDDYDLTVNMPKNPITHAWEGGTLIAKDADFHNMVVTKQEYEEHGHSICDTRFSI